MNQIFIYCGDDIVSSRKAFLAHIDLFAKEGLEIVRVAGKELTLESLEMLSAPVSLFGDKRALAIEGLLAGQKSKDKDKLINIVSLLHCSIVIWENKDFSKADQLKYPKNFVFKNFKLPEVLFNFLDSLSPGNTGANLKYLHQVLESVEAAYLFLMLIRQVRLLIMAKDEKTMPNMAPWIRGKLLKQARPFDPEKLTALYKKMLELDYRQKTSNMPFALGKMLEMLITEI